MRVTATVLAGVEDSTIQALGSWQSATLLQVALGAVGLQLHQAAVLDSPGSQPTPYSYVTP